MGLTKKISGFILLFAGLIIIFYGLYSSYNIFNGKTEAPVVFQTAENNISPAKIDLEAQAQKLLEDQLKNLLPAGSITQLLNLLSWSIFAGILVLGGGQISGIGIKLLK